MPHTGAAAARQAEKPDLRCKTIWQSPPVI